MLNELYELTKLTSISHLSTKSWHMHLKELPKNHTFVVFLSKTGHPVSLERVANDRIKSMRKYEKSSGDSFPSFNLPPIYQAETDEQQQALKKMLKMLSSGKLDDHQKFLDDAVEFISAAKNLWKEKGTRGTEEDRINKRLQSVTREIETVLRSHPSEILAALKELLSRTALLNAESLSKALVDLVLRRARQQPVEAGEWAKIILFFLKDMKKDTKPKKYSLVFELDEVAQFPYPANHPKTLASWNEALLATAEPGGMDTILFDAFGEPCTGKENHEKYPESRLPVLGNVKLRAMSSQNPCQTRYGQSDSASFPCALPLRQSLKDTFEWLAGEERHGKTWREISQAITNQKAVIFVYPAFQTTDLPELASLFAPGPDAASREESRFEIAAERVTAALTGIVKEAPQAEIRIFVLTKPDGYRTKVLLSRVYTARSLMEGAKVWQLGCGNLPHIRLRIRLEEDKKAVWIEPRAPFPAEAVEHLNTAWFRSAAQNKMVHGVHMGDMVSLLAEPFSFTRRIAEKSLRLLLRNAVNLLSAMGHSDCLATPTISIPRNGPRHTSGLLALMGLLLYKLGHEKGDYMHSAPFLVGRVLSLADLLHKDYCRLVRNNSYPPQLIGNAHLTTCLENPIRGLARLSERIAVYQAWANTVSGNESGLAKWVLSQLAEVTLELAGLPLPGHTEDADKAQMLLGYLARPKRQLDIGPSVSIDSSEEETNHE